MKVYRKGHKPDPKRFGGTFSMEAELSDDVVAQLRMMPALRRFAFKLLNQYAATSSGNIVGVELSNINFSFITEPKPK